MNQDSMAIRHEPRFSVRKLDDTIVTLAVQDTESDDGPATISGAVADVSATGLRLALDDMPPKDARVSIHFQIPEINIDLMLEGVVRWIQPKDRNAWWVGCSLEDPIPDEPLQRMATHAIMDRRQDERLPTSTHAKAKWELSSDVTDVVVTNYSMGGCSIETGAPVEPASDRMLLVFESEDGEEKTQIPVRVIWSRGGTRFGCTFLSNRGFLQLRRFVESESQTVERAKRAADLKRRYAPSTKWRWIAITALVLLALQTLNMLDYPWVRSFRSGLRSVFESTTPVESDTQPVAEPDASEPDA